MKALGGVRVVAQCCAGCSAVWHEVVSGGRVVGQKARPGMTWHGMATCCRWDAAAVDMHMLWILSQPLLLSMLCFCP